MPGEHGNMLGAHGKKMLFFITFQVHGTLDLMCKAHKA